MGDNTLAGSLCGIRTQNVHVKDRPSHVKLYAVRVRVVHSLSVLYPGICLRTEEKARETLSQVVEKCQLDTIRCVSMAALAGSQDMSIPNALL
jgi:hypothetical protein